MTFSKERPELIKKVNLHGKVHRKLRGTGFEYIFATDIKTSIKSEILHALVETYNPETGLFSLGQVDLYYGLEDVLFITGLPIDGKPLTFGRDLGEFEVSP